MSEDLFKKYYDLPMGKYINPVAVNLDEEKCATLGMNVEALTCKDSIYPILGPAGMDPCVGLIAENRLEGKVYASHTIFSYTLDLVNNKLFNKIRDDESTKLFFHVIGASSEIMDEFDEIKAYELQVQRTVIDKILEIPNVEIITFDIGNKTKPTGALVDSRNSRLYKDSPLEKINSRGVSMPIENSFDFYVENHISDVAWVSMDFTAEKYLSKNSLDKR